MGRPPSCNPCCPEASVSSASLSSSSSSSISTISGCEPCGTADFSKCWELTVAGIGGNPASCSNLNGVFILDPDNGPAPGGFACRASSPPITMPDPNDFIFCVASVTGRWSLGHIAGVWRISAHEDYGSALAFYDIHDYLFDCFGENTLISYPPFGDPQCCESASWPQVTTFPATLTVEPAVCQ